MKLTRYLACMLLAASVLGPTTASAWTRKGHEIVAYIGELGLSSGSRVEAARLLATEGKISLTQISSWADDIRALSNPKQPMHSVRLPLDASPYDAKSECRANHCVVGAIEDDLQTLRNTSAPDEARLLALKYLVHFVGDVHQSLHASVDTGGEIKVRYRGTEETLHYLWDHTCIAEQPGGSLEIAKIINASAADMPLNGGPASWAIESRNIARDAVFPELKSLPITNGVIALPDNYCEQKWPLISSRLVAAGRRLGFNLNVVFSHQ